MPASSVVRIVYWIFAISLAVFSPEPALSQTLRKAPEIKSHLWVNSHPYKKISMKVLRGKVVLVFFWTLSDANCESALLNLNAWYARYKNKGLEIIGVCTPEWEFNATEAELLEKVLGLGVKFPVMMDKKSEIRNAYGLLAWPSFFLVDREGYIRGQYYPNYNNFTYRNMEIMLNQLLEEGASARIARRAIGS